MKDTLKITTPSDREIAMTRVFNAPRTLVFEALTKPELVKRWLTGPPGWSMPVCEIDLRVGGAFRYVWRHDDGREMGMGGVFREVVPPERLVGTEKFDNPWYAGEALATHVLVESAGRTTLPFFMLYVWGLVGGILKKAGKEGGAAGNYGREGRWRRGITPAPGFGEKKARPGPTLKTNWTPNCLLVFRECYRSPLKRKFWARFIFSGESHSHDRRDHDLFSRLEVRRALACPH